MQPMNRHVRIDIVNQASPDTSSGGVLMPEDYNVVQEWQVGVVKEVSSDCERFSTDDLGGVVVFPGNMLVCVDALGGQYHFVQENYVVCKQPVR